MENTMIREELIRRVLKGFITDLGESCKLLSNEDGIKFTKALIEYLKGVYNYMPSVPEYNYEGYEFDEDEFIDENLLTPFREKMVPFVKTRLKLYFAKDEHNQSLLFQKLKITEPIFTSEEYLQYILRIYSMLMKLKENLYLKPADLRAENTKEAQELLDAPEEMEKQGFKSKNKEYTRSRQVLMYHFVLKLMGVNRNDTDAVKIAEFGHVLFNWPVDVVKNNDLYKKLIKAPLIHQSESSNLKDLEFVKRQFEKIDHAEGIALVQKQIDSLKRK